MAKLYDVVVKNRHVEGENIAIIEFESASSTVLPKVEAGAHIDVYLPNGMVRQYSLCQNPAHIGIFRLGILRDPESRGGSVSAFDDLKEGMKIQVSEPKNLFSSSEGKTYGSYWWWDWNYTTHYHGLSIGTARRIF